MVWRRTEIRFEYRLPRGGCGSAPGSLKSDEYRVDFFQNLGVVELHCPAMLRLVVVVEDSETMRPLAIQLIAVTSPGGIYELAVRSVLCRQIERVKDQRLPLRVEGAAERLLRAPLSIPVNHVHNVQFACAHDVAYLTPRRKHLAFAINTRRDFGQSCFPVGQREPQSVESGFALCNRHLCLRQLIPCNTQFVARLCHFLRLCTGLLLDSNQTALHFSRALVGRGELVPQSTVFSSHLLHLLLEVSN